MTGNYPWFWWTITSLQVASIPVYAYLMLHVAIDTRALVASLYFTWLTLFFIVQAIASLNYSTSPAKWGGATLHTFMAIVSAIAAQYLWDEWNRRRRKRPKKKRGRVALRLRRLVLIPD